MTRPLNPKARVYEGAVSIGPDPDEARALALATVWKLCWHAIEVYEEIDWGLSFALNRIAHESDLSPRQATDALELCVRAGHVYRQRDRYSLTEAGRIAGYVQLRDAGQLPKPQDPTRRAAIANDASHLEDADPSRSTSRDPSRVVAA